MKSLPFNLPTQLTLGRIVLIPLFILLMFVNAGWATFLAWVLFTVAAATDFLDGYLARKNNQVTELGRLLDPIADKLLVAAALFMLVYQGHYNWLLVIPAVVIVLREFFVSALREFMAGKESTIHVSNVAKWKTAAQLAALSVLLLGSFIPVLRPLGLILIWVSAALTVYTAYGYFSFAWQKIKAEMETSTPAKDVEKETLSQD